MSPTILVEGRAALHGHGKPRRTDDHQHRAQTIVNVIDFGMNAQEAVDAGRFHHQWLPDRITYERFSLSPDTLSLLRAKGHEVLQRWQSGCRRSDRAERRRPRARRRCRPAAARRQRGYSSINVRKAWWNRQSQDAPMPRCPDVPMPRCPDVPMSRCPDAPMPRCPDVPMPRCPDAIADNP